MLRSATALLGAGLPRRWDSRCEAVRVDEGRDVARCSTAPGEQAQDSARVMICELLHRCCMGSSHRGEACAASGCCWCSVEGGGMQLFACSRRTHTRIHDSYVGLGTYSFIAVSFLHLRAAVSHLSKGEAQGVDRCPCSEAGAIS